MRILTFFIFIVFSPALSSSQCFNTGGIGGFEQTTLNPDFIALNQGNGTLELSTAEKHSGNQSLKAVVTTAGPWQVRLYNDNTCNFNKTVKGSYTVSFFLKGEIGDVVNVSIMDNTVVDQTENVTITSTDWTLYKVYFQSTSASTQGKIKLIFTDIGTYYLDELTVNTFDCNNQLSGTASFDDCGICSGGNTGLTPINSCTFQNIDPTDSKLVYDGVLESDISTSKATFYRMKKSYVTSGVPIYYDQENAAASSGIAIRFKTSSPKIKMHFQENLTLGDDVFWHTFDVFKDGNFQFSTNDFDFELSNSSGQSAEWKITLPTFSVIEFLNLELLTGFSLETVQNTNKPAYIAIGNSITHGRGINSNSTRFTYPWLIADSLGYELYNWGIGGSKVYDGILDNFSTGIQPNLVTILWGYNDVHIQGFPDHFQTSTFPKYETLVETIAKDYPNACVMLILPTYSTNPINTTYQTIDSLQSGQINIIKKLQAKYNNINYLFGTNYTDANGLNDVVHLNESGNNSLAMGVISKLPCSIVTSEDQSYIRSKYTSLLFPNPTKNWLFWKNQNTYSLYDISGKLLANGEGKKVNLQGFKNGFYILQIGGENFKVLKI